MYVGRIVKNREKTGFLEKYLMKRKLVPKEYHQSCLDSWLFMTSYQAMIHTHLLAKLKITILKFNSSCEYSWQSLKLNFPPEWIQNPQRCKQKFQGNILCLKP